MAFFFFEALVHLGVNRIRFTMDVVYRRLIWTKTEL